MNAFIQDTLASEETVLSAMPGITQQKQALLCFSHLRWDFVFQRPQHLMTRASEQWQVFFIEEPVFSDKLFLPRGELKEINPNLNVFIPHLPPYESQAETNQGLEKLVSKLIADHQLSDYIAWYYTPLALDFTAHLQPAVVVYDCMDELSAFKGASPELKEKEILLLSVADLVFTGGRSLYEAKKDRHPAVYAFPSSIDKAHFMQARQSLPEPEDQQHIPHPRLGFFGVIDERFDIDLLTILASRQPDWHFIVIGPVVKINPDTLPQSANIHYLGMKNYQQLPAYLSGWDVALLLFAINESTRFISPTKTPEYLASLKPVVSTPIQDVMHPYQELGLVHIGEDATGFERAITAVLAETDRSAWQHKTEAFLAGISWDSTWQQMQSLILSKITK